MPMVLLRESSGERNLRIESNIHTRVDVPQKWCRDIDTYVRVYTRIIENYFDDIFAFSHYVSPCEVIFGFRGIGFCDKQERGAASL